MRTKYFATGVLVAVLVIFATGADNTNSNRTQWEYAEYSTRFNKLTWESPECSIYKEDTSISLHGSVPPSQDRKNISELKSSFASTMGMSLKGKRLTTVAVINHVGLNGWELISESQNSYSHVLYFKRPKQ